MANAANRYWVGGTASWNGTAGSKWALTSGGAGGQAEPAASDDVFFDGASGTVTVTVDTSTRVCKNLDFTGFTGTFAGTTSMQAYGSLTLGGGMSLTNTGGFSFFAASGTHTLTTNGVVLTFDFSVGGNPGSTLTVQLADDLISSAGNEGTSWSIRLLRGTFDANGNDVTIRSLSTLAMADASTLTMGAGVWTISDEWEITTSLLTINGPINLIFATPASGFTGFRSGGGTFVYDTIDVVSGSNTFQIFSSTLVCNNLDFTGFVGELTGTPSITVHENLTFGAGMTSTHTGTITFDATSGTRVITSNGVTLDSSIVFNGVGGTWQLADHLATGATRTITLTNGTFNANNKNVTTGLFSSANSNVRTLTMGTGTWVLSGTGTIWTTATTTNLTFSGASATIKLTDSSATARTISAGSLANFSSIWVSDGTGTVTFTDVTNCVDLNFTGFAGTCSPAAISVNGNLAFGTSMTFTPSGSVTLASTSGTKTITGNGNTAEANLVFDGAGGTWQFADTVSLGATRTITLTRGTLDFNGQTVTVASFSSSNSNTRGLSGTGTLVLTSTGTVWTTATSTGMAVTGTGLTIKLTNSSATSRTISAGSLANFPSIWVSAGTGTVTFTSVTNCVNLDFTGFTGTADLASAINIGGNLTLGAGMALANRAVTITLSATSGTKVVTSSGVTVNQPVAFNGAGGTWQLADNLTTGNTANVTLTSGTLNLNGMTLSPVGSFQSSGTSTRTLKFSGGTVLLLNTGSITVWNMATSTNATIDTTGGGTIKITGSTVNVRTFAGGGLSYPTIWFSNATPDGFLDITGSNTFAVLKCDTPPQTIRATAASTTTVTAWQISGTAGNRIVWTSITAANHNLVYNGGAVVDADYLSISRSQATPASNTWYAGANSVDGGNNSGWIFSAAVVIVRTWAALDGGTPATVPVDVTVTRFDLANRIMVEGVVRAYALAMSLPGVTTPALSTNDYLSTLIERDVFLVGVTLGEDNKGTAGTLGIRTADDGTSIATTPTIAGALGGGVADASANFGIAIASGSIVRVDITVEVGTVGQSGISFSHLFMPGQILWKFAAPEPMRVESIRAYGESNGSAGTTTFIVKKNGTAITGGTLTATPSANVVEPAEAAIAAGNGDFAVGDILTAELTTVSDGLKYLTWRLLMRSSITP